jgi:DNA-directed RNA polymerase subunit K/omega
MKFILFDKKIDIILFKNIISFTIMPPKKAVKKVSKKEDSDDDYDVDDDVELDDIEEVEVEDFDEEIDEEKDELNIEPDTEAVGCALEEAIDDDDEYFDNNDEIELQDDQNIEYVSKENRLSSNRLTKYEMVRILGERCKQLTMGAKPLIKNFKDLSYDKIAEEEFLRNMIPFKIKRPLPNGKYEIWNLEELSKDHLLSLIE